MEADFEVENDDLSVGWRRRSRAGRLCKADWLSWVIFLIYKSHHKLFLKEDGYRGLVLLLTLPTGAQAGRQALWIDPHQSKRMMNSFVYQWVV